MTYSGQSIGERLRPWVCLDAGVVIFFTTSFRCSTLTESTRGNTDGEKTRKTICADEHNRSRVGCDVMGEANPGLGRIRIQKETCKKQPV